MTTYYSYTGSSPTTHYVWTGTNTLNEIWSQINVSSPLMASAINIYWCAYSGTTYGYHMIWDVNGNIVVQSGQVSVGTTAQWVTANISSTLLSAGTYYIGIWGNPAYNRYIPQWSTSTGNSNLYQLTATGGSGPISNTSATINSNGVIGGSIDGTPAGMVWVNQLGTWKHGIVWVNQLGTWKQAQAVWINQLGTWKQSL